MPTFPSKEKFEEILKSESSKTFFEGLPFNDEISPATMVSQLTEKILTYAGECSLIKTKKKHSKKRTANSPCFDIECVKLKKEMQHLAKSLKNSPDNNFIRENIYLAKRKYQSTLKKKKNIYKHAIIEEMHSCGKGDAQKF